MHHLIRLIFFSIKTFEQFKKALAEYDEDFTVGYHEQPTEQDLKDLYRDFLEFGKSLDEYLKDC